MDLWRASVPWILEQDGRRTWRLGRLRFVRFDHNHSPVHARYLGAVGRRISGDDRYWRLPDEGSCSPGRVFLSAEARFVETITGPTPRDCFFSDSYKQNTFWGR